MGRRRGDRSGPAWQAWRHGRASPNSRGQDALLRSQGGAESGLDARVLNGGIGWDPGHDGVEAGFVNIKQSSIQLAETIVDATMIGDGISIG